MKGERFRQSEESINPVERIKSNNWLPGNIVKMPPRKVTSFGESTGEIVTEYRLEDGVTDFAEEVTDLKGNLVSRMVYWNEGGKTRQLLWEPEKNTVSEYVRVKTESGSNAGWNIVTE